MQPINAPLSILVTLSGIVTFVKLLHSPKAYFPILITLLPIVTLVKAVQKSNALSPILVTLSGIVMLIKLLQFSNAYPPILTTGYPSISDGIISSPVIDSSQSVIVTSPFFIS